MEVSWKMRSTSGKAQKKALLQTGRKKKEQDAWDEEAEPKFNSPPTKKRKLGTLESSHRSLRPTGTPSNGGKKAVGDDTVTAKAGSKTGRPRQSHVKSRKRR